MLTAIYACHRPGLPTVSEQLASCHRYAKAQGLEFHKTRTYTDEPIKSQLASRPKAKHLTRCGAASILDEANHASWPMVIAASRESFVRHDAGLDLFDELVKIGKFVAVVGDELGLNPQPEAEKRRPRPRPKPQTVAERLLRGREAGARAGKHQSGPAPYGYTRDYERRESEGVRLVIEPDEAEVVRLIFREYLRRKSMKRLIEHLHELGQSTRRGKNWSRAGLSWILKNETYLGRVHFGKIRAKGRHPAIISPIVFNKVQRLIRKNNKRGGKGRKVLANERRGR